MTSATSSSTPGGAPIGSGSGGPPRPIVTTTTSRSRASSRARCAETAVLPTRLPVPITAIEGSSNSRRPAGRSGSRLRCTRARPRARARPSRSGRPAEHRLVREIDDDLGAAEARRRAALRSSSPLAELLASPDQDRARPIRTAARRSARRTTSGACSPSISAIALTALGGHLVLDPRPCTSRIRASRGRTG